MNRGLKIIPILLIKRQFYSELVVKLLFSLLINIRSCKFIIIGNCLCNSRKQGRDLDIKTVPEETTTAPRSRIKDTQHLGLTRVLEGLHVGKQLRSWA